MAFLRSELVSSHVWPWKIRETDRVREPWRGWNGTRFSTAIPWHDGSAGVVAARSATRKHRQQLASVYDLQPPTRPLKPHLARSKIFGSQQPPYTAYFTPSYWRLPGVPVRESDKVSTFDYYAILRVGVLEGRNTSYIVKN